MPLTTGQEFTSILNWDGGGNTAPHFTDVTLEAQSPLGTSFAVVNSTTHYLYLGHDEKFDMAIFDVDTLGSIGALTWQYHNGTTWVTFIPASARMTHDPDLSTMGTAYGFTEDGVEVFPQNIISTWAKVAINSITKYWIRVTAAAVSTAPTLKRIQMRPVNAYCTTQDVFDLLQLTNVTDTSDFTDATIPTKKTVEQYIEAAQSKIDFRTRKSWRPNYMAEEYHDFNLNGFKLRRNDAYKILNVHIWDGADFEQKTQGRKGDYFLTPDVGIVNFSRYFLLPARFQAYNAPIWRFGGGEFLNPIKVTYLYGRDINMNPQEAGMVYDMAKKMAAIDVSRSSDFGQLVVSGTDRVQLMQRIEGWNIEIEDRLDALRAFEIF